MRFIRFLLSATLIFSLLTGAPAASAASADDITCQLLNYYQCYQENARTDIERLLQQLESVDAEEASQWRTLMESWRQVNQIDFSQDHLPDDLPDDDSLCIVVMGYQLGAKGRIQEELEGRLKIALTAAQQYPNAYILVTGSATGSGSSATEAGRMADWLIQNGVSSQRIIQETQAYSTEQNAIYGLKLLQSNYPQVRHLALVTSDYHMIRSHLVFAARQAEVGGEIIDIVAHACYGTVNSNAMSYTLQAELIAMMAGLDIEDLEEPTLSKLTGLTLSGSTSLEEDQALALTVTAEYNTGFTRDVTADTVFSGFDPDTPGTQIVNAAYTENGITAEGVVSVEVTASETEAAPTETSPGPTEEVSDILPNTANTPEEKAMFKWLIAIAAVLLILLLILLYELRQQHLRRQRRKRRKRKRMQLE